MFRLHIYVWLLRSFTSPKAAFKNRALGWKPKSLSREKLARGLWISSRLVHLQLQAAAVDLVSCRDCLLQVRSARTCLLEILLSFVADIYAGSMSALRGRWVDPCAMPGMGTGRFHPNWGDSIHHKLDPLQYLGPSLIWLLFHFVRSKKVQRDWATMRHGRFLQGGELIL
jgi:hypothetical protein